MAYSKPTEVQSAAGGEAYYLQLVDPDHTGQPNQDELAAAQAEADSWIDSYAQRRLKTPFVDPLPPTIVTIAAHETVYRLMQRRNLVPGWAETAHKERLTWLQDLARGYVSPGLEPELPRSSAVVPEVLERSPLEPVSRAALKGFW